MSWASRRRLVYLSIIFGILALIAAVPVLSLFESEPTCFDRKQNQGELGADCGGPCLLLCQHQVGQMQILWSRAFPVRDGVYNALAFIENPNFNAAVPAIEYQFQLYDTANVLITSRRGVTHIATDGITPIFEAALETGNRTPWRTVFQFRTRPQWIRIPDQPDVTVHMSPVERDQEEPRIEAVIRNNDVYEVRDIEVVVAVFDEDGNAMAGSKTQVSSLLGGTERPIFFTWQEPFPRPVSRVDIIPRIPPSSF